MDDMDEAKKKPTSPQGNSKTIGSHDTGNSAAASFIPARASPQNNSKTIGSHDTGNSTAASCISAGAEKVDEAHVSEYEYGQMLQGNQFHIGDDAQIQNNQIREYLKSFPAGYRFNPLDEELVYYYLQPKIDNVELPPNKINDVNIYKGNPEELAEKYKEDGELEKEWYFFTSRDKKYPNGGRPNRLAVGGYWKATGTDDPITRQGRKIGMKKSLVFYAGKAPRGVKTSWIMHEYRIAAGVDENRKAKTAGAKDMQLDKWVLCRIYNNKDGCRVAHHYPKTAGAIAEDDDGQEDRKGNRRVVVEDSNSPVYGNEDNNDGCIGFSDQAMFIQPLTIREGIHNMRNEERGRNQNIGMREGDPGIGTNWNMGMRERAGGIETNWNMEMEGGAGIETSKNVGRNYNTEMMGGISHNHLQGLTQYYDKRFPALGPTYPTLQQNLEDYNVKHQYFSGFCHGAMGTWPSQDMDDDMLESYITNEVPLPPY